MPVVLYKPGQSGNPAGRPVGIKTKPWLTPDYWHDLVVKEWKKLEPNERAAIAMKGFATVLPKTIGSQTPEQSAQNADAAFKMLRLLQEVSRNGRADIGVSEGSVTPSLDDRRSTAQASETPTSSV